MEHHKNVESKREIFSLQSSATLWYISFKILYAHVICTHPCTYTQTQITHHAHSTYTLHMPQSLYMLQAHTCTHTHGLKEKTHVLQLVFHLLLQQ